MDYFILILLWTAYCALHSYLISIGVTALMKRVLKRYYAFYRLFYVVISFVLLIPLLNYTAHFGSPVIITWGPTLNMVRIALMTGSLGLFFYVFFFDYDSLSFFGIRQILGRNKTTETSQPGPLKRNGFLGIIRHPMYFALIIYLWCQTRTVAELVVNLVLTIYVIIGTILEEKKLVLEFGETYINYQQEVPMLIPFTKKKHK